MAQHLGNTVFVIWEQKIILVCNVTRMASSGYRSELQKLNGQMAEMGVVCGVSNKFDGLEKLPHFVEAAYAACQYQEQGCIIMKIICRYFTQRKR